MAPTPAPFPFPGPQKEHTTTWPRYPGKNYPKSVHEGFFICRMRGIFSNEQSAPNHKAQVISRLSRAHIAKKFPPIQIAVDKGPYCTFEFLEFVIGGHFQAATLPSNWAFSSDTKSLLGHTPNSNWDFPEEITERPWKHSQSFFACKAPQRNPLNCMISRFKQSLEQLQNGSVQRKRNTVGEIPRPPKWELNRTKDKAS